MKAVIKFFFLLIVLVVVGIAAALYLMPINKYLEKAIIDYAKSEGLQPLTLKISELSGSRTVISDLVLGEPPVLTVKKIEIPYDLVDLIQNKHVKLVVVDQPSILAQVTSEGVLSLGILDGLIKNSSDSQKNAPVLPPFEAIKIALGSASINIAGGIAKIDDINFTYRGNKESFKKELSEKQWKAELSNIDMQSLLKLLKMEEIVSAKGSFSGTLPVQFKNNMLHINEGILKTEEGGVIQYKSGDTDPLKSGGEQAELVANVLKNLNFTTLNLQINSDSVEPSRLKVVMHVIGSNPDVENGRPVDLTLNLSGNLIELVQNSIRIFELPEEMAKEIHEAQ